VAAVAMANLFLEESVMKKAAISGGNLGKR